MPEVEKYENLVLGSGAAGKLLTWTLAGAGHRTAVVERGPLGGACPNVACLPSKNIIQSARVASLAKRGAEFGLNFQFVEHRHGERPAAQTVDGGRPSGVPPQPDDGQRS
jgi:pyruvate/2-oxoglutarate dehydrogenase complex dihydrolipoamide dehydrogenase (E3) component